MTKKKPFLYYSKRVRNLKTKGRLPLPILWSGTERITEIRSKENPCLTQKESRPEGKQKYGGGAQSLLSTTGRRKQRGKGMHFYCRASHKKVSRGEDFFTENTKRQKFPRERERTQSLPKDCLIKKSRKGKKQGALSETKKEKKDSRQKGGGNYVF